MMDATLFMSEAEEMLTPLYKIAYCILRSQPDAEDAVQQGLLKAWAAKGKADPERFRAWVTRIVINESRNIQRYRMRVTPCDVVEPTHAFQPLDADVMGAVYELPEKLRIPFSMKYITGYQEREIAEAMRVPLSTVKGRLARAREQLRTALIDWRVNA